MLRDWLRSSAGVLGCFGGCIVILGLAILIIWQIMRRWGQANDSQAPPDRPDAPCGSLNTALRRTAVAFVIRAI
jgi:hypothetical protein